MKIIFRIISGILLIVTLAILVASCNDDDSSTAKLFFSRSIYILPSSGNLTVELKVSVAPETDLKIPVIIEGTAILDEDYVISAKEFVIKAGETNATLTLTPKNNLVSNREIRLSINPAPGYTLGDKKVAIIPIEVKERIMYTFEPASYRLLSEIKVTVRLGGETSDADFKATTDIVLPLEIDPSSTAVLGTDFELENGITSVTVQAGSNRAYFKIKIKEGAEDYVGKTAIINLKTPTDDPNLYYPGSLISYNIKLDQLKFIDMLGKWKPVAITNKDLFMNLEIPNEEWEGMLPERNDTNDYLEFVQNDDGTTMIVPHLNGDLTSFFCNPAGHAITFSHIGNYEDYATWDNYDISYFTISQVNTLFSKSKKELGDVLIGLERVDENNIIVYFHEYTPTDFLVQTCNDYGFDPIYFGITYTFTRVEE